MARRAAYDIVEARGQVRPVHFIEIGAGLGTFTIDLFLALKHQGKDMAPVANRGVDPSEEMNAVYQDNFRHGQLTLPHPVA